MEIRTVVMVRPNFSPNSFDILEVGEELVYDDGTNIYKERFNEVYKALPQLTDTVLENISLVKKGYNLSYIAIGPRETGKSYCLLQSPHSLIPNALLQLTQGLQHTNSTIFVNMYYATDQKILDLLHPNLKSLELGQDIFGRRVEKAQEIFIDGYVDIGKRLRAEIGKLKNFKGLKGKGVTVTVFTVKTLGKSGKVRQGKLCFVDFSGLEERLQEFFGKLTHFLTHQSASSM